MVTLKVNVKEEQPIVEEEVVESVENIKPIGKIGVTKKNKEISKKALKMQKASRKKNRK
jgi:hypothetical protein